MRAKQRMWFGAVVSAALVVAALSGCSSDSPTPLSGVVGTGTLHAAPTEPALSGRFEIVADSSTHSFVVKLIDLKGLPKSEFDLSLTSQPVGGNDRCSPGGLTFGFGRLSSKPNQSFPLPVPSTGDQGLQNPSFLRDATITSSNSLIGSNCQSYVLAGFAPIHWTIGDIRPDIKVSDGGPRAGARGTVSTVDGQPRSYAVVAGDNFSSIGERFHITVNDIFYLNPARSPSPEDPNVKIGEILNLSKVHR